MTISSPSSEATQTLPPRAASHPLSRLLLILLLLSVLPALLLAFQRVQFEQAQKTVALVMDYPALVAQARRFGLEPQALLDKYKALGVNGVALYDEVIGNLEQRGQLYIRSGAELSVEAPGALVKTNAFYTRSLKPGVAEALPALYTMQTRMVTAGGHQWIEWPTDPRYLPVGPDREALERFKAQNLTIVYRPYDDDALKDVTGSWPEVPFVAFNSEEVIGARNPELLQQVSDKLGQRLPAIIEGVPQKGLPELVKAHGGARLFAMNPAWQAKLGPLEVASKYNLAARERGMRLLYLRPYPTVVETEGFLTRTRELLGKSGLTIAAPQIGEFRPTVSLRWLSILGPLLALALLALSFPLRRLGVLLAVLTLLLAVGLNKAQPFSSAALIAAVTFPALGLVLRRYKVSDWFLATGFSLLGVLFVSALGTSRESALGLEPFRGVGLTLIWPLCLVAASFIPAMGFRRTLTRLYHTPVKLGDLAIVGLGLALFALSFLRRGNATGAGVSSAEADARTAIQDSIVRPRFKEVAAHPLAILGLSGVLPGYVGLLLILSGVMGQASILNTFSHFHTPLLISAARCFLGLGLGLLFGLVAVWAIKWLLKLWQRPAGAL